MGQIRYSYVDIAREFERFYTDLHTSTQFDHSIVETYLDNTCLTSLPEEEAQHLNADIRIEEVITAISGL